MRTDCGEDVMVAVGGGGIGMFSSLDMLPAQLKTYKTRNTEVGIVITSLFCSIEVKFIM